jgi:hypothetical protein
MSSSIANLPKTYKAALQKEAGKPFEFIDVEMKEPGPGKVLVKVSPAVFVTRIPSSRIKSCPSSQGFPDMRLLVTFRQLEKVCRARVKIRSRWLTQPSLYKA